MTFLLIFLGSGFGGILRYGISNMLYGLVGRSFPYGTLFVNAIGALLMGFFFVIILERVAEFGPQLRAFFLIGLLGGFTTFSSFSLETVTLFENGAWLGGCANIMLNVMLCLTLTWLGASIGRQL